MEKVKLTTKEIAELTSKKAGMVLSSLGTVTYVSGIDESSHDISIIDIAKAGREAFNAQTKADSLASCFSDMVMGIYHSVKDKEQFERIVACIRIRNKWGKAPKGLSASQASKWQAQPTKLRDTVSIINKALELGIEPYGKGEVLSKDGNGKKVLETKVLNSLNSLKQAVQYAKQKKEESTQNPDDVALGKSVQFLDTVLTKTGDLKLGGIVADMVRLYTNIPDEMQDKLLNAVQTDIINKFKEFEIIDIDDTDDDDDLDDDLDSEPVQAQVANA